MKISVNWLKEYVDIDLSVEELVTKIGAQLGAVEEVIDVGKQYQGIVIAKVMSCEKHPNADKLSLCKIDDGKKVTGVARDKDGLVQVVCGAPNVKAGLLVAWIPPGATVPKSYDKEPFVLEAREIRGQVSNGMLASASELAIGDDHSGIVELTIGETGQDFAAVYGLDDYVIDIENKMFTHRPDCFGILGVAREIAGITGKQFKSPSRFAENPESPKIESDLHVEIDNKLTDLVPRFTAQAVEGVHVKPASLWLQSYLSKVGIRPINNIVDVTNYVMYLTAQPLHAYDYDKLCKVAGTKTATLETRLSKKGDKLKLLNGKTIVFDDKETVLITSNGIPVGIGGVMGGADTEVDETTKSIVLECANFDMYNIRRTSMRHGLFTDAVTRFNKGQSPLQNLAALYLASGSVQHQAGGGIGKVTDTHAKLKRPIAVHVTRDFINHRLGLELPKTEMATLLRHVEFDVAINGPNLAVTPPFWRTDIEIPEDIVEEVGRLYGFDHLNLELPKRTLRPPAKNALLQLKQSVRQILSAAGANEVLTYNFVHSGLLKTVGQNVDDAFELSNALSPDLQYYRTSITPNLLEKVHPNIKAGFDEFAIFEIGKTHKKGIWDPGEKSVPNEEELLSLVVASKNNEKGVAYFTAQTYLRHLLNSLNLRFKLYSLKDRPKETGEHVSAPFDPQRSACIEIQGELIGFVGEYKPSIRRSLKLPKYCAGFELATEFLLGTAPGSYQKLSRYPSVTQDITLKVKNTFDFAAVEQVLIKSLEQCDERVEITPAAIYQRDKPHSNYTFHIEVTSETRTLQADYVNGLLDSAAANASKQLGAERV